MPKAKQRSVNGARVKPSLGREIDAIRKLQLQAEKLTAQASAINKQANERTEKLFQRIKKDELRGAVGSLGKAVIDEADYPSIANFDKFMNYVEKHDARDMIRKQPNLTAVRARWDDGKEVPGIERRHVVKLKIVGLGKAR